MYDSAKLRFPTSKQSLNKPESRSIDSRRQYNMSNNSANVYGNDDGFEKKSPEAQI